MSASEIERTLIRLAHEIVEKTTVLPIRIGGHPAQRRSAGERLAKIIQRIERGWRR
jgi:pyrimidine operon attenuation protein/uracil phosphoribosyltransferase